MWYVTISDFKVKSKFRPAKANINADALSRNIAESSDGTELICALLIGDESLEWSINIVNSEQNKDVRWSKAKKALQYPNSCCKK